MPVLLEHVGYGGRSRSLHLYYWDERQAVEPPTHVTAQTMSNASSSHAELRLSCAAFGVGDGADCCGWWVTPDYIGNNECAQHSA